MQNKTEYPRKPGSHMTKQYYIYSLSNASRRIYVGVTNNLERRVYEHKRRCFTSFSMTLRSA